MIRGDVVDYTIPALVDVDDGKGTMRAAGGTLTRPAIVLEVHDDGTADLHVFWADGENFPATARKVSSGEVAPDATAAKVEPGKDAELKQAAADQRKDPTTARGTWSEVKR